MHQDFPADSSGSRKMSHPFHNRRGSGGASASSAPSAGSVTPADDQQPSMQSPTTNPSGSSSPGLQHHHPQSLTIPSPSQAAGAQVKKKSGFQITSVTLAQISVSTNNSIADDTESYDDMDESHTEDLSSSEMLDVSVSRATDTGVRERSSSDETLNSLHGVETPGVASPNEPLHPLSLAQASQQHPGALVNGTVHHHHQQTHDQPHGHPPETLEAAPPPVSGGQASAAASSQANATGGGLALPAATVTAGAGTETHLPSNVSANVTHASMPVVGGTGVPSSAGSVGFDGAGLGTAAGAGVLPAGTGPPGGSQVGVTGGAAQPVAPTAGTTTTTHTQTAPGSRFRVVKLDSNMEPIRKGRWMCTEYYEKEVPPAAAVASDPAAAPPEAEAGNGSSASGAAQPLLPYPQQTQDYAGPQAVQKPPGLVQNPPLPHQEPGGQLGLQQAGATPSATPQGMTQGAAAQAPPTMTQQLPYAVDAHAGQPQTGYPAPQFPGGLLTTAGGRQPDFIQPTAPFQTQAQGPLATMSAGVPAAAPVAVPQPLPRPGHGPPSQAGFGAPARPQGLPAPSQLHPQSLPPPTAAPAPYVPLTALQADLQPLLTTALGHAPGAGLSHGGAPHGGAIPSMTASQLQDALFQHQSMLGRPRPGAAGGRLGGASEGGGAGLAQMGMVRDAAGFVRTQTADGEEDSSSGTSVVAIDNKIEQAMDLVKSHLMYAVREEVEVLKEQIKELMERNSQLEQENNLLKTLASPEQMAQFQAQVEPGSPTGAAQPQAPPAPLQALPSSQSSGASS